MPKPHRLIARPSQFPFRIFSSETWLDFYAPSISTFLLSFRFLAFLSIAIF